MGTFEKFIARTFFFWMVRFLRSKYRSVKMEFIAHHTEARRVSEQEFFSKGESGGTICSSAYRLALDLIRSEYPSSRYNIYPVHFSDGDNLTSDNELSVKLVGELLEECNVFGYGEINQYHCYIDIMRPLNLNTADVLFLKAPTALDKFIKSLSHEKRMSNAIVKFSSKILD